MLQKKLLLHWGFILLVVLSLLGCTKAVEVNATFTPSSVPPLTRFVPSPISNPTKTEIPSSPSLVSDSNEIVHRCIQVTNEAKQLGSLNGVLVLNGFITLLGRAKQISNPGLLVDLRNGSEISLPVKETDNHFQVSPGGDYLAYDVRRVNTHNWQVNILDDTGTLLKTFDEEELAIPRVAQ